MRSVDSQVNQFSLGDGFITLLELIPPAGSGVSTLYLCNDNTDVQISNQTYTAYPFEVPMIDDAPGGIKTPTLVIDNTDRQIVLTLRSILQAATCRVKIVWMSDYSTVIDWCTYKIRKVNYNIQVVSASLTLAFLPNDAMPAHIVDPGNAPGAFGRLS